MSKERRLWLMFADEADQDGSKEYLVSAAVFIPADAAGLLHRKIETARKRNGFKVGDDLKFSITSKPIDVTADQHTSAKNAVIDSAIQVGCKCCFYLTPHSIAKGKPHSEKLKFAYNTLISQFNIFLKTRGDGVVCLDRTTDFDQFEYLKSIFQIGLDFQGVYKRQENIIAALPSTNNSSHFSSVADIITGAFRWVVNEPEKDRVGKILWNSIASLMWIDFDADGQPKIWDRGFCLRPKTRAVVDFEADCRRTIEMLKAYSKRN